MIQPGQQSESGEKTNKQKTTDKEQNKSEECRNKELIRIQVDTNELAH